MSYSRHFHSKITQHTENKCNYPIIDSHLHFVDFAQNSDGMKVLLKKMDAANIKKVHLFGLPVIKKWESFEPDPPSYYLDDNARCYYYNSTDEIIANAYLALDKKHQKRIAASICGFNPTDKNAVYYIEKRLKQHRFWKGIGEVLCRHDDLTNLTKEETARMNHGALFPVYDLAASKNLPVLLHQNSSSVGHHDRFEYLHEVTIALSKFPKTKFVWGHCGISRRVSHKDYHKMIDELLADYKNLYVDISWVVYDNVITDNLDPKKHWVDLIEKYPNRFFIGTDLCGHFKDIGKTIARYNKLLDTLKPSAKKMIATENAEKLWFS